MRLIRFGPMGKEKPGVLDDKGIRRDLSAHFFDWDAKFFGSGGMEELTKLLGSSEPESLPTVPEDARWGAPVARPGKVICIGLNYSDHAAESGMPIPTDALLPICCSIAATIATIRAIVAR